MKANEICRLASEIVEFLAPMDVTGADKLVALRSAAAIFEAIQNQEILEQAMKASLTQLVSKKP